MCYSFCAFETCLRNFVLRFVFQVLCIEELAGGVSVAGAGAILGQISPGHAIRPYSANLTAGAALFQPAYCLQLGWQLGRIAMLRRMCCEGWHMSECQIYVD
jgi:hypothetical protein